MSNLPANQRFRLHAEIDTHAHVGGGNCAGAACPGRWTASHVLHQLTPIIESLRAEAWDEGLLAAMGAAAIDEINIPNPYRQF